MEIKEYLEKITNIENSILKYIEDPDNIEENYQNFAELIELHNIQNDKNELKLILNLLLEIANEHHRVPDFMDKIFKIITYFKDDIKKNYSNIEIFNIFENNKRVLLFLIENQMIEVDQKISSILISKKYKKQKYPHYFYPEIKSFLHKIEKEEIFNELHKESDTENKSEQNIIDELLKKREIGENDDFLCEIIHQDLLDDFISCIEENDYPFDYLIYKSIFETNQYLSQNKAQLIEYVAFCGSIKIFNYICSKTKEIPNSVWIFAVHSQNEEIFKTLKKNSKKTKDSKEISFIESLIIESIKCHHDNINHFIQKNLVGKKTQISNDFSKSCIEYYNFSNISTESIDNSIFIDLVRYDYFNLVKLLLKNEDVDVNKEYILFK